jgi:hypothetical protein
MRVLVPILKYSTIYEVYNVFVICIIHTCMHNHYKICRKQALKLPTFQSPRKVAYHFTSFFLKIKEYTSFHFIM